MPIDPEELEYMFEEFLQGDMLTRAELQATFTHFGITPERVEFSQGPVVLVFEYEGRRYVVDLDENTDEIWGASTVDSWLDNVLMDAGDYVEYDDGLGTFWTGAGSPPPVYHATDEDNVESILAHGLKPESQTRGLANRWVGVAVYASFDPYRIDAYGDTVLVIDTAAMKRDGVHPALDIEPSVREYEESTAIAYAVGAEDYPIDMADESEDYETVVMFGHIPPQYIRVLASDAWPDQQ
jgi:hypothetical protein